MNALSSFFWSKVRTVPPALAKSLLWLLLPTLMAGCNLFPPSEAQTTQRSRPEQADQPVAVKTAQAKLGFLAETLEYTGSTRPDQQVALRAQVDGEVVNLAVDIGDTVEQGAVLAQLDSDLLTVGVTEAQAELSARQSELAQAEVSISDAQAAVVQAQATLDQAQIDADRLRRLANQGASSEQEAEAAELALTNAQQALRSAQAQVNTRQQAMAAAAGRVDAQQAVVAQTQKQLSFAELRSPLTGVVLARPVDTGDYVESGDTVVELGDLRTLKVTVQISELDLGRLSIGQSAQIRLDAFPDADKISGRVTRISPLVDATSRLAPVEIAMPNPDGRIGSGLLARVQFTPHRRGQVVAPASALEVGARDDTVEDTVFVIQQKPDQITVVARLVTVGQRRQDKVEILSGLEPNESFVIQTDRPLSSGQRVRLSILSEPGGK